MALRFEQEVIDAIPTADAVAPSIAHGCRMNGICDAEATMVFARQLEQVSQRVMQAKYPALKARTFIATTNEAGDAAEYLVYRYWDSYCMAKLISNYQTDIPLVTASAQEKFVKFHQYADAYLYSVDDMRQAQRAGVPLDSRLAEAARRGIELAREDAAAVGEASVGTFGLTNHPNVPLTALPNGNWSSAAPEEILEDLNYLVTSTLVTTQELFSIDTILLSLSAYRLIQTKLLNLGNASNVSVLEMFQRMNPGVLVDSWVKLEKANATGDGGRLIAYNRSPDVVEFASAIEFETMPTEYHHMVFTTVCRSRWAGVILHYPMAITYADNQGI